MYLLDKLKAEMADGATFTIVAVAEKYEVTYRHAARTLRHMHLTGIASRKREGGQLVYAAPAGESGE